MWKKNRNKYASLLLRMVINGKIEIPFSKIPPEDSLPQFQFTSLLRGISGSSSYRATVSAPKLSTTGRKLALDFIDDLHIKPVKLKTPKKNEENSTLKKQLEIALRNEESLKQELTVLLI